MFGTNRELRSKTMKSGRVNRDKPAQKSLISRTTSRRLNYLADHGLMRLNLEDLEVAALKAAELYHGGT